MNFPPLSAAEMRTRLTPPSGRVRLAIDTDCANEIDDQFALAWALLSPDRLEIEGVYAEPFSFRVFAAAIARAYELMQLPAVENEADQRLVERFHSRLAALVRQGITPSDVHYDGSEVGMERSYHEILKVYELLGMTPGSVVARGAPTYMTSTTTPVPSAAAEHLIGCALRADERPLYVAAIGCVTNVASAILMAPEIVRRIVVLWTAGYPTWTSRSNTDSFNLVQDVPAAQVLFDCGVPMVYLPGFHVGAQLRISLPEMEQWVRGYGPMGDYLYWLYTHNPIQRMMDIHDHFGRTWVIWDLINIAWLLNPDWAPSEIAPAARLRDDTTWEAGRTGRHLMREAYGVDRDAIFRDFFFKLHKAAGRA